MKLTYGHASFAQCAAEQLTLCLSAQLFSTEAWAALQAWFQTELRLTHWLSAPFRLMTAEEDASGSPRWKQIGVDVLSWLIFHLLVPPGHALVKLWQTIDWAAINRLCATGYQNSHAGQRAWAPAQLFALLLLFFVLPVPSESELLRMVAIVPLYRWFCGFGLFSALPDHSTLHTFRKRIGVERFEAILTWVVHCCLKAGLIANELAFFDMTGVTASAHPWTPFERAVILTQALIRYLERLEPNQAQPQSLPDALRQLAAAVAIEVLENKGLTKDPKTPSRVLQSLARHNARDAQAPALWEMALEEAVQTVLAESVSRPSPAANTQRHGLKEVAQRLKALLPHARGDLDARVGWVNDVRLACGYWLGFLVDSLHGIITAVRVVPLNVVQASQLPSALQAHQERLGAYPKAVAADSAQDFYPVHQALDARHIEGHIASRDHAGVGGGLGAEHFTWDEERRLHCPTGPVLQAGKPRQDGLVPFRAQGCATCPQKSECLPKGQRPDGPRVIHLEPAAHQRWQKNRAHTHTPAYREAQKQRFVSEGLFGLAKRLHGADKMPYRSTPMNQMAGLMVGIAMNLVLLARPPVRADAGTG